MSFGRASREPVRGLGKRSCEPESAPDKPENKSLRPFPRYFNSFVSDQLPAAIVLDQTAIANPRNAAVPAVVTAVGEDTSRR